MKRFLKKILVRCSGNRCAQDVLQNVVRVSHVLMGIGAGANVAESGEIAGIEELKHKKKNKYVIFDVGANKGQFLQLVLSRLGEYAQIHAFEPNSYIFQSLRDFVGSIPNVSLNPFGLGKMPGEFNLYYNKPDTGLASLTKRNLNHLGVKFTCSERVRIETVDRYCAQKGIDFIDLMKIDVEGHELDVLEGAKEMLKKNAIGMISFEFGGCNIDTRTFFRDFYIVFKKFGMKMSRITPSAHLYPLEEYGEIHEQFQTTNFLVKSFAKEQNNV